MDKLFFELIQVSTGQLDCLSRGPEPEEWQQLYEMACQQHLVGVCYRGVQLLFEFGLRAPQDLAIDWMSEAELIEERNNILNERCVKVQQRLAEKSFKSSILAGQGAACDYGETLHMLREPDGIDIYANGSLEELMAFVKRTGQELVASDRRMLSVQVWDDMAVHLHYRLGIGRNPMKNKVLKRWFEKNRKALYVKDGELTRPSAELNVVYLLVSLYWKFLYEGVSLRELMDYFFALKRMAAHEQTTKVDYAKIMDTFGMLGFSQGVMWVMQEVFGLAQEALPFASDEEKGSFILYEVMSGQRNFFRLLLKYPGDTLLSLIR
ncbi:MAG: nucleotidyltransferase family protein [Prevotella sp.]|nr:nucleotidyltransferase family protein [Prevotella sp.]